MAFTDQYALGNDATFQGRIQVAVLKAAAAVQAEDKAGLSLPVSYRGDKAALHDARVSLASRVLADPSTYAARFAAAVAADPNTANVSAASDDAALLFTVNSLWNAFAVGA